MKEKFEDWYAQLTDNDRESILREWYEGLHASAALPIPGVNTDLEDRKDRYECGSCIDGKCITGPECTYLGLRRATKETGSLT